MVKDDDLRKTGRAVNIRSWKNKNKRDVGMVN